MSEAVRCIVLGFAFGVLPGVFASAWMLWQIKAFLNQTRQSLQEAEQLLDAVKKRPQ